MPQRKLGNGAQQVRVTQRGVFRLHQQIGQYLPRQQSALAVLHRAGAGNQPGLQRERRQQPLRERMDCIDPQPPAGAIEHGGKQRARPCHRFGIGRRADGIEAQEQLRLFQTHPFGQRSVDARGHFGGARLGESQAQDLRRRNPVLQQKPQHARGQNLRLAGARRCGKPDAVTRIDRQHLVAVQRMDGCRAAHAPSPGLGSDRPPSEVIHSSSRIS